MLYGRGDVLERAERLVKNPRARRPRSRTWPRCTGFSAPYGLADSVLLDLGEVSGFDYYSGVHFEAYVSGLGAAPLAGAAATTTCSPASAMIARLPASPSRSGGCSWPWRHQGTAVPPPGPDFFVIDFTAEKTRALALSRRLRDGGAAVARDIMSRPLDESLAYARQQRARWALVIGEPGADAEQVRIIALDGRAAERRVPASEILTDPAPASFQKPEAGGRDHAKHRDRGRPVGRRGQGQGRGRDRAAAST